MTAGQRVAPPPRPDSLHHDERDDLIPGTTRFDLVCQPDIVETAAALVQRWATDRVLSLDARRRLATLTDAALRHGLRYDPRGLTIRLRWVDPERIRLDLRWRGDQLPVRAPIADSDLEATIAILEALTDDWGVGGTRTSWIHWLIVQTQTPT